MDSAWSPTAPPAPSHFSEALFAGVRWHQRWEIFRGIFTPGQNPVEALCNYIRLPRDLRGKRVLDIGTWNGCFSFECARRGATEVVAFGPDNPAETGFDRVKEVLQAENVRYHLGSAYELDRKVLGAFDIVLFLGVLYHLRYPLLAIDKLKSVASGMVFVETHVIDNCVILPGKGYIQGGLGKSAARLLRDAPLWQFYRHGELGGDPSSWFGPNVRAVIDAFGSAGFEIELVDQWGTRAAFRAAPRPGAAEFMSVPCYEAQSEIIRKSVGLAGSDLPTS